MSARLEFRGTKKQKWFEAIGILFLFNSLNFF